MKSWVRRAWRKGWGVGVVLGVLVAACGPVLPEAEPWDGAAAVSPGVAESLTGLPNDPPAGAWDSAGEEFLRESYIQGRPTDSLLVMGGAVATGSQSLYGRIHFVPYRLTDNDPNYDYYLFTGDMRHAVSGYGSNAVSVGYYAREMNLTVKAVTPGSQVYEFGPNTTVENVTESFNLAVSLQGGFSGEGTVGVSAGFSVSFEKPSVSIYARGFGDRVEWDCKLPHVGFISPGVPADPRPPSSQGYAWKPSVIIRTPEGEPAILSISSRIHWDYDYTRGITYDSRSWSQQAGYVVARPGKVKFIRSMLNAQVLDVKDNDTSAGADVILYSRKVPTAPNQQWILTPRGHVVSKLNGYVLDVKGGNSSAGTEVIMWPPNNPPSANQLWTLNSNGQLVSRLNGYVLDIAWGDTSGGGNLIIWPANLPLSNNQRWVFE